MKQKHSIFSRISFACLIATLIFIVLIVVRFALEKYSVYGRAPAAGKIGPLIVAGFFVFSINSLWTGVVGASQRDTKKILPTISLSILSFILFIVTLIVVNQAAYVYHVQNGVVTNYGIFDIPTTRIDSTRSDYLYEQRFLKANTDKIPALIGTHFGFNYVIPGEPTEEYIRIMKITKYPEPGLQKRGRTVLSDTVYFSVKLNEQTYSGFRFDNDYELIPGKWEFELWYKGNKLLSRSFDVYNQR